MDILQSQKAPFIRSARTLYRAVRSVYRKTRALKNYCLNSVDRPKIVLVYHRVTDLTADPEMLAVSPDNFRLQMEYLKKHYCLVRFEDEWSDLGQKAVAITFDDGYADNVHEALPILEQLEVPATFFVSTGQLDTDNKFWWDRLESILRKDRFPARFTLHDPHYGRSWDTVTPEQRRTLYAGLNMLMKKIPPARQEAWLDQLDKWAGPADYTKDKHRCMTREEVKLLAASPWATIGAHTVTHSALASLNEEQQRDEILSSKLDLETITGEEIKTFSYPFGRKTDYNRTSVRLCREAGFVKAASNFPGQVHRWTDPYQIPRHLVRNWDLSTFTTNLESFWTR